MPATLVDYLTQVKNGLTASAVAAAVWAASPTRSATAYGSTPISSMSTALAGNASADLRPPSGFYQTMFLTPVGGGTTYQLSLYDGVTFVLQCAISAPGPSGAPGTGGYVNLGGTSVLGPGIVNNTATPGSFAFVGRQLPL